MDCRKSSLSESNLLYSNHLPSTVQITMQLPRIAINSITPNKNAHSAFCSHGISNGRFGGGLKHSAIKSLQIMQKRLYEYKKHK